MRKVHLIISLVTIFLLLTSCQLLRNENALPPAPPRTELHLLGWQHSAAFDQRLQQTLGQIVAATTTLSVSVELVDNYDESLTAALKSDFPPDIVFVESGRLVDLASAGLLQPMGEQIEASDDFFPVLRQTFTFRGRYYCPPFGFSTLAILYNRQMFDDASIAYPTDDWTWQDFSSAVRSLTDPNAAVAGLALDTDLSRWLPFLYAAGGSLTDNNETTITLNSPETAAGFHLLDDLWTDFSALKPADMRTSWAGEALGKQRAALAIEGDWAIPYLQQEFPEVNIGIVALPTGSQSKSTLVFASCLAVPANAKHPKEAIQLINQLLGADALRSIYRDASPLPPRIALAEEWTQRNPAMKTFVDAIAYAHPWRFFPGFAALKSNIEGNLQRMYKAEIAVEDLLNDAEEAGKRALSEGTGKK